MKNVGPLLCGIAQVQTLQANILANSKQHSKKFRVSIWGLGDIEWRKNWGSRISWYCILKANEKNTMNVALATLHTGSQFACYRWGGGSSAVYCVQLSVGQLAMPNPLADFPLFQYLSLSLSSRFFSRSAGPPPVDIDNYSGVSTVFIFTKCSWKVTKFCAWLCTFTVAVSFGVILL
jgi:hypothetical protein